MKVLLLMISVALISIIPNNTVYAFNLETDVPTDCSTMPDKESETYCAMAKFFHTTIPQIIGIHLIVDGEIATQICNFKPTQHLFSAKRKALSTEHLKKVYAQLHALAVEPVSRPVWCNFMYDTFGPNGKTKTPLFK